MNATVNRQILLVEKPTGKLGPEHFKLAKGTIPEPKDGEALVRTRYIRSTPPTAPGCMAPPTAPRSRPIR
jgi:NADPH-dependent curcumin reductase CurA